MSVGVMKDYKLKQRNLRASHTLGWSKSWSLGSSLFIINRIKRELKTRSMYDPKVV